MFGQSSVKHNNKADDLYKFLEEADKAYIKAFETRSIGLLKNHFSRNCCYDISRWIVAAASSRYFSDEKFRQTTWDILEKSDSKIVLEKTCVYKNIKLSLTRSMKISEDYKEKWVVSKTDLGFIIESVVLI
jgi:hypothetical protein